MPRFYCDIYLTHDSSRVRKDHNNGWKHRMHIQNYFTELDGVKVQQIINSITKAYVYAGLGGFPELPGHPSQQQQQQQKSLQQRPTAPMAFNPSILASLPPPPGFRMPTNAAGMPVFPPPPPGMMFPPQMSTTQNTTMNMNVPQTMFFPPPPPPLQNN